MSIYELEDITAGLPFADPYGLNIANQVVGDLTIDGESYDAFVERSDNAPTITDPASAFSASLKAINDSGFAVGSFRDQDGVSHAFMVDPNNGITDLSGMITNQVGGRQTWAADINNNGLVTGSIDFGDGNATNSRGFLLNPNNGNVQVIPGFASLPNNYVTAINNSGDVVGTCFDPNSINSLPFLFSQGSVSQFVNQSGFALDINDQGHIACSTQDFISNVGNAGPFLFANGQTTAIPVNGIPNAINNHDQVVGNAMRPDATSYAFIFDGGLVTDLNTLIFPPTALQIFGAWDINDKGNIVAGALDSDFAAHMLLLTPPPTVHYVPQSILGLVGTILFGVTQDGGGVIYFGRRPVPIDPWGWLSDAQVNQMFQRAASVIQQQFRGDMNARQQALGQLEAFKATVGQARKNRPPKNGNIGLEINVRRADGSLFQGTVDVDCQHQTLSDHRVFRSLDGSKTIAIRGLKRSPEGLYQVTVTPTAKFEPVSQFLNIPPSGFVTAEFVIR